jgi:hypothetical protein
MAPHTLSGAIGTGIIIGGYFLMIARLVRTPRSDGVSTVFIVLSAFQTLSCLLIALASRFRLAEATGVK